MAAYRVFFKESVEKDLRGHRKKTSQGSSTASSMTRQAVAMALVGAAVICAILLATAGCGSQPAPSSSSAPAEQPQTDLKVVITKSERRLDLCSGGGIVHTYRVGLGSDALDDKEREGDGRTPEGEFYVCVKNPESKFYRSLGLSYPNREDAERGLRDGLISDDEFDRIVAAIDKGKTPPQDTRLGGEIYIHGGGAQSDWTAGCIALGNEDMQELYDVIDIGTPVTIKP